jgi:hypothetical protein
MDKELLNKMIQIRLLYSNKWNPTWHGYGEWYEYPDYDEELGEFTAEPYECSNPQPIEGSRETHYLTRWEYKNPRVIFCIPEKNIYLFDAFDTDNKPATFVSFSSEMQAEENERRVKLISWDFIGVDYGDDGEEDEMWKGEILVDVEDN